MAAHKPTKAVQRNVETTCTRDMTTNTSDLNLLPHHQVAEKHKLQPGLSIPLIPIPHPLSLKYVTQLHCKAFNGSYNQQPPHLKGFCG